MTYPLRTNLFAHPAHRNDAMLGCEIASEAFARTRAVVDRLLPAVPLVHSTRRRVPFVEGQFARYCDRRDARHDLHRAIYPRLQARATGRLTALLERAQEVA